MPYKNGKPKGYAVRKWVFTWYMIPIEDVNSAPYQDAVALEVARWKTEGFPSSIRFTSIRWMIMNLEKCPSTGRLHYQGFIHLHENVSMSAVKKILGSDRPRLEPQYGPDINNDIYCTKTESRFEGCEPLIFGKQNINSGKRTDLDNLLSLVKQGFTTREILNIGGSSALAHINFINKAVSVFWHLDPIDKQVVKIRAERKALALRLGFTENELDPNHGWPIHLLSDEYIPAGSPEVEGNTSPPPEEPCESDLYDGDMDD